MSSCFTESLKKAHGHFPEEDSFFWDDVYYSSRDEVIFAILDSFKEDICVDDFPKEERLGKLLEVLKDTEVFKGEQAHFEPLTDNIWEYLDAERYCDDLDGEKHSIPQPLIEDFKHMIGKFNKDWGGLPLNWFFPERKPTIITKGELAEVAKLNKDTL